MPALRPHSQGPRAHLLSPARLLIINPCSQISMKVSEPSRCFHLHRTVITSALNTPTPSLFWEPSSFHFKIQSVDEIIANLGMEQLCPRENLKRKAKENSRRLAYVRVKSFVSNYNINKTNGCRKAQHGIVNILFKMYYTCFMCM